MRSRPASPVLLFGSLSCYLQACQTLLSAVASLPQPDSGAAAAPQRLRCFLMASVASASGVVPCFCAAAVSA